MNKAQQITEDQQAENPQWNTQMNKNVYIGYGIISIFSLILCPHCTWITCWKHCRMTHLIQVQEKNEPNQCHHPINHPHFRLNTGLIINKYP